MERLAAIGAPVAFEDVAARAAGAIGRPHVADALVAAGHARDRQDAFDRYLADGGPARRAPRGPRPARGDRAWCAASGGAPVLAHPGIAAAWAPGELAAFVQPPRAPGAWRGIEVHRPEHTPERRGAYAELARRNRTRRDRRLRLPPPRTTALRPGDTGDPPLPARRHRPAAPGPRGAASGTVTGMTTATDTAPSGPRAAGVHWDLSPLVADADAARALLAEALERCRAFEARYRGALRRRWTAPPWPRPSPSWP